MLRRNDVSSLTQSLPICAFPRTSVARHCGATQDLVDQLPRQGAAAIRQIGADGRDNPPDTTRARRLRQDVESPSDLAWDRQGNVFVTDAGERPRIITFDSRGRFLAATGRKGSSPGSLDSPHSLATDASGNVYVADSGNSRIQVFDNSLKLYAVYDNIGTPWAVCITEGSRQFLFSASNRDKTHGSRRAAEIYKLELDGTILGKAAGDDPNSMRNPMGMPHAIATLQHIHCRDTNTIVGVNDGASNLPVAITFAK